MYKEKKEIKKKCAKFLKFGGPLIVEGKKERKEIKKMVKNVIMLQVIFNPLQTES